MTKNIAETPESASNPRTGDSAPKGSKWVSRFDSWIDVQAGVRLIEDRENRRLAIQFDEKPPEAVRAILKRPDASTRKSRRKPCNPSG